MESKSAYVILIAVVALLALSLAALAGYVFIVQGAPSQGATSETVQDQTTVEVPGKEERIIINLSDEKRVYNLKSTEPGKTSVIQLFVSLDCYKTLKRDKKEDVAELVNSYKNEIQELVIRFFMTKTIEDVQNIEFMDKAKQELADQINALLNEGHEEPEDVVYKVIFSEWLYQ